MKTKNLHIPLSMTAALAGLVACAMSCAKKSSDSEKPGHPPEAAQPTNTMAGITNGAGATNSVAVTRVTAPAEAAAETKAPAALEITNLPPAETTLKAPEPKAPAETNIPGHLAVVEMPATPPAAPPKFYPVTVNSNALCVAPVGDEGGANYRLTLRAGYEHINHGDNNDSYYLSAKFYAWGDGLREAAGKNGWLVPDMDAEIASEAIAKPDQNRPPGSDDGLRFRADFTWPWLRWTARLTDHTNSFCPFGRPMEFRLGPTVNLGFDHLYDETEFRLARYAGVRLTFNRSGFIEYTAGGTDGLDGTRQQILAELPFYESHDGEVRYYLRGLWNHGANNRPDVLEAGLFVEMPFSLLVSPEKWNDLVPFSE
ncbi:MAG: hypothetical protein ABSH48_11335 [Verrucomicrobiota bacterium]